MTRIDRHFLILEPPAGGLQRLRARLDRGSASLPGKRPIAAMAVLLAIVIAGGWIFEIASTRHQETVQLDQLRRILADRQNPVLAINGRKPQPLVVESDRVEVYFVQAGG